MFDFSLPKFLAVAIANLDITCNDMGFDAEKRRIKPFSSFAFGVSVQPYNTNQRHIMNYKISQGCRVPVPPGGRFTHADLINSQPWAQGPVLLRARTSNPGNTTLVLSSIQPMWNSVTSHVIEAVPFCELLA